jgi:hypothetical protein
MAVDPDLARGRLKLPVARAPDPASLPDIMAFDPMVAKAWPHRNDFSVRCWRWAVDDFDLVRRRVWNDLSAGDTAEQWKCNKNDSKKRKRKASHANANTGCAHWLGSTR